MSPIIFFSSIVVTGLWADGNISVGIALLAYILLISTHLVLGKLQGRS